MTDDQLRVLLGKSSHTEAERRLCEQHVAMAAAQLREGNPAGGGKPAYVGHDGPGMRIIRNDFWNWSHG